MFAASLQLVCYEFAKRPSHFATISLRGAESGGAPGAGRWEDAGDDARAGLTSWRTVRGLTVWEVPDSVDERPPRTSVKTVVKVEGADPSVSTSPLAWDDTQGAKAVIQRRTRAPRSLWGLALRQRQSQHQGLGTLAPRRC